MTRCKVLKPPLFRRLFQSGGGSHIVRAQRCLCRHLWNWKSRSVLFQAGWHLPFRPDTQRRPAHAASQKYNSPYAILRSRQWYGRFLVRRNHGVVKRPARRPVIHLCGVHARCGESGLEKIQLEYRCEYRHRLLFYHRHPRRPGARSP